jgi:hypothetical protein
VRLMTKNHLATPTRHSAQVSNLVSLVDNLDMEVGDDVPDVVGVEALLFDVDEEDDEEESDIERERWSARRMSSKLTLFELRVARHMRESSSMCSVNFETTIVIAMQNMFAGVW